MKILNIYCIREGHDDRVDEYLLLKDGIHALIKWICTRCENTCWEKCKKEVIEKQGRINIIDSNDIISNTPTVLCPDS